MGEKPAKTGVKKIEEEIEYRKFVLRPELTQAVKEARVQGDLSENFEYYAVKREKSWNGSCIGYLGRMLKFAIITGDRAVIDEVGPSKTVGVYFVDENESEDYKVVTSIRSEMTEGRTSVESPLGKALLEHKVGDCAQVSSPRGGYEAEIHSITEDHSNDVISSFQEKSREIS